MEFPIYLDNHATTPVDPHVLEALLPYMQEHFGNTSSATHAYGWKAQEAVDVARRQVAALLGASSREVIFTAGATESNNLAILGAVEAELSRRPGRSLHVISSRIEHPAVLDPCALLEKRGVSVTYLEPSRDGLTSPEAVSEAVREDTFLVSVMAANNEIGSLAPLEAIGVLCKERGILFHTDAAQAAGKVPLDVASQGIDLLSLSGHKLYAPKGVGALYVRSRSPRVELRAQVHGGGQERGLRSGTLNVPGIVGLGKACELAATGLPTEAPRLRELRDRLWSRLSEALEDIAINGPPLDSAARLDGNLNVRFARVPGEALITELRGLAVSSGSACSSQRPEPSHVLAALGVRAELAHASLRFGIGRFNDAEDIDRAGDLVIARVRELREVQRAVGGRR